MPIRPGYSPDGSTPYILSLDDRFSVKTNKYDNNCLLRINIYVYEDTGTKYDLHVNWLYNLTQSKQITHNSILLKLERLLAM